MHKAEANYYPICLDFKFNKIYIIWIGDDVDGVLINNAKRIIAFRTKVELTAFGKLSLPCLAKDITYYDVYSIQQWLTEPNERIDCELVLNLWNLFTDVAESLGLLFLGDVKNDIRNLVYDKLFNGSGIFIADDPNPLFNDDEVKELSVVIQNGFDHLLSNLALQD